jgi:hypothetical protein
MPTPSVLIVGAGLAELAEISLETDILCRRTHEQQMAGLHE